MQNFLPSWVGPRQSRRTTHIGALRPQADARPVVQPEPFLLRLPLRDLQPLPPPNPFHPLHVHRPAGIPKQRRDAVVAVASILAGERDDVGGQRFFIGPPARHLSLCGAMLTQDTAGEALRHLELLPNVLDAGAAAGGTQ